jgi:hypothetical protein
MLESNPQGIASRRLIETMGEERFFAAPFLPYRIERSPHASENSFKKRSCSFLIGAERITHWVTESLAS